MCDFTGFRNSKWHRYGYIHPDARYTHLGVQFEMEVPEGKEMSENAPALKAMKEAARQLGLTLEVEE